MKRLILIEQLQMIQYNIETVEGQINQQVPAYYRLESNFHKWIHLVDIREKALKYWKRRFNRVVLQLGYYL